MFNLLGTSLDGLSEKKSSIYAFYGIFLFGPAIYVFEGNPEKTSCKVVEWRFLNMSEICQMAGFTVSGEASHSVNFEF